MRRLEDMTEPELTELMTAICGQLRDCVEAMDVESPHFAILLFNDPAVVQYAANCDHNDVVTAMRECADRLATGDTITRE